MNIREAGLVVAISLSACGVYYDRYEYIPNTQSGVWEKSGNWTAASCGEGEIATTALTTQEEVFDSFLGLPVLKNRGNKLQD
ncbi:MAG: hypothetical protein ABW096_16495 [Candidatus Thiodiazotropha sp.]